MKTERYWNKRLILTAVLLFAFSHNLFAATTNVAFGNFFFNPPTVTINVGDTVVWTNTAPGSHTVTGIDADPICGPGTISVSCSHTFDQAGTFPYVCTLFGHADAGMTGVVMVVQANVTPPILSSPTRQPDGQFAFTVTTAANRTNVVEASTNFSGWIAIGTNVGSSFNFTDPSATALSNRFYRVVQP